MVLATTAMATGGGRPFSKSASTDPRQRRAWARTGSATASDKEDNISVSNDQRPNNWVITFRYNNHPCVIHF